MTEAAIGLVLDCSDPVALARLWTEALGLERVGAAGSYLMLVSPSGRLPKLLLQQMDETKAAKNRMHLDIETFDVEAEAARLESTGARRLEPGSHSEHGSRWIVMVDPDGNEFCACDGDRT